MIIITQLPFLVTLGISFMNWNAYYPDEIGFNGLDNYRRVLTDANTRSAIVVTVILTVAVVLISLVLGLLIALLLDRQFRGRGIVRTMMITPFLIVPVAAALLWKHALSTRSTASSTACCGGSATCSVRTGHSPTGSARRRCGRSSRRWSGSGRRS